jgi:amino acid transporter
MALFITVAAVDTGVVLYFSTLCNDWFNTSLDASDNVTVLLITLALLAIQTALNITGANVMARAAQFGVYIEIIGTFGIAVILAIHGFHHGLGYLFSTQGAENASTNAYALDFGGNWLFGAAIIAVLAPVYIYYGFESCGDIAEETKDAGRQIPRAMRLAIIWGGVGSIVLTAALLLAIPKGASGVSDTVEGGGVPAILGELPGGVQDLLLVVIIFAFFSCGTSIQGAGSRLAFSYARDGALPGSAWIKTVHSRFRTPVNALLVSAVVSALFVLLVFYKPDHNVDIGFITYPQNVSALLALISFGVSGIYLSFLLTVIGAIIARLRGWVPEGSFRLGQWGWVVTILAAVYLGVMLVNVVAPTGLDSPRAFFNYNWITLLVVAIIAVGGALYFLAARPDRKVRGHLRDEKEATGAERAG